MSKKSGNTLMAFLFGAAAGTLIGILYAPDKGTNTREKLSFQLDKYREVLQELINDFVSGKETPLTTEAKSQGQKVVDEAKNKAERLLEDVDELLEQIRGKKGASEKS
jgi:gas vesicle protein